MNDSKPTAKLIDWLKRFPGRMSPQFRRPTIRFVGDNLGYWGCMAVACESGGRRPVPLHFRVWSAEAPGHVSENVEVESGLDTLTEHTRGRGIYCMTEVGTTSSSTGTSRAGASTSSCD